MRRALALGLLLLVACTDGADPTFARDDLPRLVLGEADAPKGTSLVPGDSGYLSLERYAEDEAEVEALAEVGFQEAYVNIFWDPKLYQPDRLDPERAIALSYVVLFDTPENASAGLRVIEADVRADGSDLEDFPADGLGAEGFGLAGELEPNEPEGVLYGWRIGNVVQMMLAAGAPGAINPKAVKVLAQKMVRQAR